jgi:hypothetical protein
MGLNDTSVISEHHHLFLNMHDLELQKLHRDKLAAVPAFWQFLLQLKRRPICM